MTRKSFILMVAVFLLAVSGFAFFIHSLNTQAIGEERGDRRGFSFTGREKSGEDRAVTTIQPQNQPPEGNWILMGTDSDEGYPYDLKALYAQDHSGILYFKVEFYRDWVEWWTVSGAIVMDTDDDSTTACEDQPPGQNHGMGADYWINFGDEGNEMYKCIGPPYEWDWYNPIPLAYVNAMDDTNIIVLGVYLSDVETAGIIDCATWNWEWLPGEDVVDWIPDTGHFTFSLCNCGDANGDGAVDVADVMYLINYVFLGTAPPDCY
jgi:hypothetical protein